jgi:hypothetical protein
MVTLSRVKTLAEEEAYEAVMGEHDLRRRVDRAAGLNNVLYAAADRWREFLQTTHADLLARWPAVHDAIVDARRWENPVHFNGTFAEKVARAAPLPAISTVGQMERLILRSLVMLELPSAERERLIKAAYDAEKAAQKLCEESRVKRLGPDDIDLTGIEL